MKKLTLFLAIFFLSPLPLLAQVYIVELMPNIEGEPNTEYIVLQNTGCSTIDISNYQIADKKKQYSFAAGSTLASYETYKIAGSISKIELNNTDEELYLRDAAGALLHTYTYSRSTKNLAISVPGITLDTCMNDDEEGTDTIEDIGTDATEEDESISGSEEEGVDGEGDTGTGTGDTGAKNTEESQEDNSTEEGDDIETQDDDSPTEKDEDVSSGGILEPDDEGVTESSEDIDEDIQTSHLLGKSGSLAPQMLLYSDGDGDNRIDMLEVLYDVYITGSIDVSRILLYSNTGGLYDIRANTATGYIIDAEIEGNILRLFIEPSHFEKSVLIHNATTQSHIRLKSSGGFGVTNLTGAVVDDFFLTSSFDAYREVYEKGEYESLGEDTEESGGSIGGTSSGGSAPIVFPEIIPTIQNYTNTTFSGNIFICRETPCRLNLNFESIFNTLYPSNSYTCRVTYNGITEDKCNPSQWNPTAAGGFDVRVTHKATGQYQTQHFPIEWNIIMNPVTAIPSVYDRSAPVPRITLNGTLTKKQILSDDNHIVCYTNTCSLNFDGSDTYDPDGSSMTYTWSLSGKIFATKKNPTIQEFSIGEHMIEFAVIDSSGKSAWEYYKVSVLGDMTVPPDREITVASDVSSKKSKKKQAINFFSPPELIVEKASTGFLRQNDGYRCVTTSASCSVNFALTGITDGVYYQFSYTHDPASLWTINPRSRSFQAGKYILLISAHYEKDAGAIWQQSIPIEVIRVKKSKTVKTLIQKASQEKVVASKSLEIIPIAHAEDGTGIQSQSELTFSILFLSILMNVFFLRRNFKKIV